MNSELWRRVQELFYEASEMQPAERKTFLEERCAGETTLLASVESLIASSEDATPTGMSESVRLLAASAMSTAAGERIGNYEVIRELARGGMGAVFLAVRADDQYRKQVAIKLMNVAIARPEMQARFRVERQILADLDHPNIARMLDGGSTPSGLPYVVMEYIEGPPVDVYCRERNLNTRQRLELFRKLCDALIYAHRNLIVHRDIKPANILVTGDGSPKLLDFGIARLVGDQDSAITRSHDRLMTPLYASPEQVRGDAITTASDVYSLGMLLCELLTGRLPVAGQHPQVDGDLANILMMTIREEPLRRYSSVDQFAEDIRRYLEGFPVVARKDTWRYRASKFVRRHRWSVAATGIFLLVLVAFGATMALLAKRVAAERDIANNERRSAEQVSQFLVDSFRLADSTGTAGRKLTAEEVLNRGSDRVVRQLAGQPALQARLMTTMGEVYENLGLYDRAEAMISKSVQLRPSAENLGEMGVIADTRSNFAAAEKFYRRALLSAPDPELRAAIQARLASTLMVTDRPGEAESLLRDSLEARRRLLGPNSVAAADSLFHLGILNHMGMNLPNAETFLRQSLTIRLQALGSENTETANTMWALAAVLGLRGKNSEAQAMQLRSLAAHKKLYGESHLAVASNLDSLSLLNYDSGDYTRAVMYARQALSMYEATVGPGSQMALANVRLANALERTGNVTEAEAAVRRGIAIYTKTFGPHNTAAGAAEQSLAAILRLQGKNAEAERIATALVTQERSKKAPDPMLMYYLNFLGGLKRSRGDFKGADADISDALAMFRKRLGESHPIYARVASSRAMNRISMGDVKGAEGPLRQAIAVLRKGDNPSSFNLSFPLVGLAQDLLLQGRAAEAEPLAREAYNTRRKTLPPTDVRVAESESVLGGCLAALGRSDEASPLLMESHRNLMPFRSDRLMVPELRRLAEFERSRP